MKALQIFCAPNKCDSGYKKMVILIKKKWLLNKIKCVAQTRM